MVVRLLLLALLAISGCLDEDGSPKKTAPPSTIAKPLAEFRELRVEVMGFSSTTPDTRRYTVYVVYHLTRPRPSETECYAVKDDVTVTLAGAAATVLKRGGFEPTRTPDGTYAFCQPPMFTVELPSSVTGPTTVVLADASLEATFDVTLAP